MERILCLVVGYVFGLFETGYFYGKLCNTDIRNYGSGNSGATNTLRVLGPKAGIVVLLGDALKTVLACLVTRFLFAGKPEMMYLLVLYTGFGVILGHNFPFYMGFKGGKGVAASAGLLLATDLRLTLICLIVFLIVVIITRYVSLGSILVMLIFAAGMIYFGHRGDYGLGTQYLNEFSIVATAVSVMGIWRHRANIKRLLSGTENKISLKKSV